MIQEWLTYLKEAVDDDRGCSQRVELAGVGNHDGPVDSSQVAHHIRVHAALLSPQLDRPERRSKCLYVVHLYTACEHHG